MKLLRMLQEASSLSIPDVKKAIQKDYRVKFILQKEVSLDSDLKDKDKDMFLETIKFYVFNNPEIQSFVASRANIKDISKAMFDSLRKIKNASELTQMKLEDISNIIKTIFKEYNAVEKASMTTELRKELKDWFNTSGRYYYDLPNWAKKELDSLPIKPDKRVLVYRGVLFKKSALEERTKYDGTLDVGNGLKFLRSIREDKRTVDLDWDRPSSWTKNKEVAERFAKYGAAQTSVGATLQWLNREREDRKIDGEIGFVISMYVKPEDVLIDTDKFKATFHMQHGDEAEVIVKPGQYLTRIVKKYTVKGEVDPEESTESSSSVISELLPKIITFNEKFNIPEDLIEATSISSMSFYPGPADLISDSSKFKKLAIRGTTTQVMHMFDQLLNFYRDNFSKLSKDEFRIDKFSDNESQAKIASQLKLFQETFSESIRTKDGSKPLYNLSAEDLRRSIIARDVNAIEPALLTGQRITQTAGGDTISSLAKALKTKIPSSARPHMFGADKQQAMLSDIVDAFYKKLDIDINNEESSSDKNRKFINILKIVYKNWQMIGKLERIKKIMREIVENAA